MSSLRVEYRKGLGGDGVPRPHSEAKEAAVQAWNLLEGCFPLLRLSFLVCRQGIFSSLSGRATAGDAI